MIFFPQSLENEIKAFSSYLTSHFSDIGHWYISGAVEVCVTGFNLSIVIAI